MIIAIGHESNVGKNTVANILFHHIKTEFPKVDVAITPIVSKLKAHCYELFKDYGAQDEMYYENNRDKRTEKLIGDWDIVDIWIHISQELKRIDPFYHAKCMKRHKVNIIPDFRTPDEGNYWIKNCPVYFLKVASDRAVRRGMDHLLDGWEKWDHILYNNGTRQHLSEKVALLFNTSIKEKIKNSL